MLSSQPVTAVVGAGAVGCYFGGMLARSGAAMTAPGHVKHSGRGDLILGRTPSGPSRVNLDAIAARFIHAGVPCRVSSEIRMELWTKMLMNCAYNAISALARERYGRIAAHA